MLKARTFSDVAQVLEVTPDDLHYLLYRGRENYPYREFEIPKKTTGTRLLRAPHPSIGILQKKLNRILTHVYEPPRGVHGYVSGRSIVSNARRHEGKRWVLNVDLEKFFPSINFGRVYGLFLRTYHLPKPVAASLAQLCTSSNELPQGAPTSPTISNMICKTMDRQLHELARDRHCWYTRYADDITISTRLDEFPEDIAQVIYGLDGPRTVLGDSLLRIVGGNGFRVNANKIWLKPSHKRQMVTGLTVNRGVNVPRRHIRRIRAMMHSWETDPIAAEARLIAQRDPRASFAGAPSPDYGEVVRGMIEYVRMVKGPFDPVYLRLREDFDRLSMVARS